MKADLIIHLDVDPDRDPHELERKNANLRSELARLDEVQSVRPLPLKEAPLGSKVADPVSIGSILMTLLASKDVVVSLLNLLAGWLGREDNRGLTIQVGQSKFEMKGGSSKERNELAEKILREFSKIAMKEGSVDVTNEPAKHSGQERHSESQASRMDTRRFGLLIATSDYQGESLRHLSSPPVDVEALAEVLRRSDVGGFEIKTLVNQPRAVVELAIQEFFTERDPDDFVLLYFSGHGLKNDSNNLYFAMTDTKRRYLEATAVSSGFVREVMQNCQAQQQVMLLDCCFSGAFARGFRPRADETIGSGNYFDVKGSEHAVITACDDMQYAFEGDDITAQKVTPSMFTEVLVEGISTGDADTDFDGDITHDDLYAYVVQQLRARNSRQRPQKWYFGSTGRISLATSPNSRLRALAAELRSRIENDDARVRFGVVFDLAAMACTAPARQAQAALQALERLVNDDSRRVSAAAADALRTITQKEPTANKPSPDAGVDQDAPKTITPTKEPRMLVGHTNKVSCVAFDSNGGLLASASDDKTIRLWRVVDGTPLQKLEGHSDEVKSVAFNPDGTLLASASRDKGIRLWRVNNGVADTTPLLKLKEGNGWRANVTFHPDGKLLASASDRNTVRLWRVADGTTAQTFKGHTSSINSLAFSPDGTLLASGSDDHTVRLWRVDDGMPLHTMKGHTDRITSVVFVNGTMLASGSGDKTVRLWRVADGTLEHTVKGVKKLVDCMVFIPDGAILATGTHIVEFSARFELKLWRIPSGELVFSLPGYTRRIRSVAFSPNQMLLASGSSDKIVRLWSLK
jgi:WD40 repeat protein